MSQYPFGSMGPLGVMKSLGYLSPTVSQWCLGSMRSHSSAMLSLVPQCHNGLLVPRSTTVSNMFPSFHESLRSSTGPWIPWSLQCHNGPIIPQGPALSQCSAWFHKALQCHSGLCGSTRTQSVTMYSLLPCSPTVSQWPLGSMVPCRTQCHSGPLSSTRPCSVTMAPCFPRALQCHNHHRITQAGKDL